MDNDRRRRTSAGLAPSRRKSGERDNHQTVRNYQGIARSSEDGQFGDRNDYSGRHAAPRTEERQHRYSRSQDLRKTDHGIHARMPRSVNEISPCKRRVTPSTPSDSRGHKRDSHTFTRPPQTADLSLAQGQFSAASAESRVPRLPSRPIINDVCRGRRRNKITLRSRTAAPGNQFSPSESRQHDRRRNRTDIERPQSAHACEATSSGTRDKSKSFPVRHSCSGRAQSNADRQSFDRGRSDDRQPARRAGTRRPRDPTPSDANATSERRAKKSRLGYESRFSNEETPSRGTANSQKWEVHTSAVPRQPAERSLAQQQPPAAVAESSVPPSLRPVMHPIGYEGLNRKLVSEPRELLHELYDDTSPIRPRLTDCLLHEKHPELIEPLIHVVNRALQCTAYPQLAENVCRFLSSCELFSLVVHKAFVGKKLGSSPSKTTGGGTDRATCGAGVWCTLVAYLQIAERVLAVTADAWQAVRLVLQELRDQMSEWSAAGWQQEPSGEELVQRVSNAVLQAREGRRGGEFQPVNDDFRLISIFPTAEELKSQQPVLRPNLPRGAFDDCEHYLGVQFRLLREDFMAPLRDGVSKYIERLRQGQPVGRLQGVRIYRRITIKNAVSTPSGVNFCLRFCEATQRRLTKKQFLGGSLLLLSANDFQTFYVATVQRHGDRNDGQPLLKENSNQTKARPDLQVKLEEVSAADILALEFGDTEFVMLETTAYFESYRHVLESLKCLNQDNLKFQQYLIQGSSSGRALPGYLKENSPVYNLECIATAKVYGTPNLVLKNVVVKSEHSWPAAHDLGLDNSQFEAFKLALTSDLAVIQGPPGTGKTYIGLKIAKALLSNRFSATTIIDNSTVTNLNQSIARHSTPLLVVCYTNHVLDQFLEGLVRYGHEIVRVGGRSRNGLLDSHNIASLRKKPKKSIVKARRRLEKRSCALAHIINEQKSLRRRIVNYQFLEELILPSHAAQIVPRLDDEKEEQELLNDAEPMERALLDDELLWHWLDPDGANHLTRREDDQQHMEKLRALIASEPLTTEEEQQVQCVWDLALSKRWQLYATWVRRYSDRLRNDMTTAVEQQAVAARELEELRAFEDANILRRADVIGMTTTGAAKYRKLLQDVQPRIIIVEEAAQVLEGHVVTMLSTGCDHLILIGDHQQLRPSVNVHELAKKYHLDVSLFERMVQNGMPFCTLTTQHRMRLEISEVMRQFYPHLEDDDGVKDRPLVEGMKFNMFYVNHNEPENEDERTASHYNEHEATFLVALCQYLLQQGFKPSQITILTPYNGQVNLLRQLIKQSKCGDVIVTSIDNYQGEENDLILLSTVRSNKHGYTGFTSIPNRICVMLSRARLGLYAIGDFEMLRKRSKMWKRIIDCVDQSGMLGKELPLMCKQHNHLTNVSKASDFLRIRDGGCAAPCDARLNCGHKCSRTCHDGANDHSDALCKKTCLRNIKSCGHRCTKLCYEYCVPCQVPVTRTLSCGHKKSVQCGQRLESIVCDFPCERLLICGHSCRNRCGDNCTIKCIVEVDRQYSCGHVNRQRCHTDEISAPCKLPCETLLACSHPCSGTCGTCTQGRLHKPCSEECGRLLVCGHKCLRKCCNGCLPCPKRCESRCMHSTCQKMCGESCIPCREPCAWRCEHYSCTRLCFEPCDRPPCDQPCKKEIRCRRCRRKSPCIGLCGEPCPVVCDHCHPNKPHREVFFGNEVEESARFVKLEDCRHVVESTGMDRWMKLTSCVTDQGGDQNNTTGENDMNELQSSHSIQVICCPMCKTPVRRCVRYGAFVKARQVDIEQVKSKILERTRSINAIWNEQHNSEFQYWYHNHRRTINDDQIHQFKQECLRKIELLSSEQSFEKDLGRVKQFVYSLTDVLRQQELDDVQTELMRIDYGVRITAALRAHGSSPGAPTEHGDMLRGAFEIARSCGKLDKEKKTRLEVCNTIIDKYAPISQAEKEMVVNAMNFNHKGHWYKCPNGHIYCIGECGGAMEVGTCPDCKCSIGGTSHRLNEDNSLASEMDGARRPAYSDHNMPDLALIE